MKNAIYVHIYRDPVSNIRSLLKVRLNLFGTLDTWFSFKPREYGILKSLDPYYQVAGQIYFIEKEILANRHLLGNRYLETTYEEVCHDSQSVFDKIAHKVNEFSSEGFDLNYKCINKFNVSNPRTELDDEKTLTAFNYFVDNYGPLN